MSDLNRMKKLAGILTESVVAVPGVGRNIAEAVSPTSPGWYVYDSSETCVAGPVGDRVSAEQLAHSKGDRLFTIKGYHTKFISDRDLAGALSVEEAPEMDEKAPPGMEDMVMNLKKEYPGHPEKAFATAWSIYNKKHGKTEESNEFTPDMAEGGGCAMGEESMEASVSDLIVRQTKDRLDSLIDSFVEPARAVDIITRELADQGYSETEIENIIHAIDQQSQPDSDDNDQGSFDMSDDAGALASAGFGSDEDYGGDHEMYEGESKPLDTRTADRLAKESDKSKWERQRKDDKNEEHNKTPKEIEEDFDLNNGYDDIEFMSPGDFFPNGADGPVTSKTGSSGARQGDNPEQKKVAVAETHKELVYNYRNFLKESVKK